mgnify:CR=1 FL=1
MPLIAQMHYCARINLGHQESGICFVHRKYVIGTIRIFLVNTKIGFHIVVVSVGDAAAYYEINSLMDLEVIVG